LYGQQWINKNSIFSFHLQAFNVDYFFIVFSEAESSEMLKNMNTRNDVAGNEPSYLILLVNLLYNNWIMEK
jgi:hypothetical protein